MSQKKPSASTSARLARAQRCSTRPARCSPRRDALCAGRRRREGACDLAARLADHAERPRRPHRSVRSRKPRGRWHFRHHAGARRRKRGDRARHHVRRALPRRRASRAYRRRGAKRLTRARRLVGARPGAHVAAHPGAKRVLHQADWIAGLLSGRFDCSDENNALKTGYDVFARRWPDGSKRQAQKLSCCQELLPPGTPSARPTPSRKVLACPLRRSSAPARPTAAPPSSPPARREMATR